MSEIKNAAHYFWDNLRMKALHSRSFTCQLMQYDTISITTTEWQYCYTEETLKTNCYP